MKCIRKRGPRSTKLTVALSALSAHGLVEGDEQAPVSDKGFGFQAVK